jgi:ssRNA-specific RNase YbeY (16S rRNA maturation enzyme)
MLHGVLHLVGMDHQTDRGAWRERSTLAQEAESACGSDRQDAAVMFPMLFTAPCCWQYFCA